MVIRSVGRAGLAAQIQEDMRLARLAAELLQEEEQLEVLAPVLSVVAFRHRRRVGESETDRGERDTELMESTRASGGLMLSTTVLDNRNTLRMVVMNHRTDEAEVRRSVRVIREHIR